MNRILLTITLLLAFASSCLALTPKERQTVQHALEYAEKAKANADQTTALNGQLQAQLAETSQEAGELGKNVLDLGQQIDKAHKHEQELADWQAKYEPTIKQVNSWWGLGAFVYGAKRLAQHLFWVALIGTGVAVALFFLAPPVFAAISGALRIVFTAVGSVIRKILKR